MSNSESLRVDYSKYQVDEVSETIADALFFPLYIGKVLGTNLAIFWVLLTLFCIFFIDNTFLSVLFWVLTFVISIPSILLFSIIRLFSTIKNDIDNVFKITLETTKHVYEDAGLLKDQRAANLPLKATFSDVFKGVAMYVIRPSLKKVLEKRIKYFAWPLTFLIDLIFKKTVINGSPEIGVELDSEDHIVLKDNTTLGKINKGGEKTTLVAFTVVKFPFRLALIIYGLVNYTIVYLLYLLFR